MRRSKIVCTLGPASSTAATIGALIDAGMDVARLNFSHGQHAAHLKMLQLVRSEAASRNRAVAVLADIQGPKIRVGTFKDGIADLRAGQPFTITTDANVIGDEHRVATTYAGLPADVKRGDQILLDDGYLTLQVEQVEGDEVRTTVVYGGCLKNNKGINLPGVKVSAPSLTPKDKKDLAFAFSLGVEYMALSFVRAPEDVLAAQRLATADGARVPIIAKIEKPEAVDRLDEIIAVADGVMVARGDLGVEMGPEKVPMIQKRIIDSTNAQGKIVITATQMLESMIQNPRPTRAEASDVANAVLDGTDAVMLSGETAAGAYPVEAVRTMSRIITEVERSDKFLMGKEIPDLEMEVSANAIAKAAVIAAKQMRIKTIAVVSGTGGAARLMSEYRPEARIIALTFDVTTYRRLALYWGVLPVMIRTAVTTDEMIARIEAVVREQGLAASGESMVITMAVPVGSGETTNMLKIHRIP